MRIRLSILTTLLPLVALGNDGGAFEWLWIELFVVIGFVLTVAIAEMSRSKKVFMTLVFFLTEFLLVLVTGDLSYLKNRATINSVTVILPVLTTFGSFWLLRSKQPTPRN